jgi:adenylylsulfate kinase
MADNIHPIFDQLVSRAAREKFLNQRSHVFWFTGLSGSGKSTIAKGVEAALFEKGYFAQVIDGDNIRTGLCNNLSFSIADRQENIRRIAELSKLYTSSGIISLCSFISPTLEIRAMAKEIVGGEDFSEIYVNTSIDVCEQRDVKGLYQKARKGEIKGFTGIDSPYEAPINAALEIKTDEQSIEESVAEVLDFIIQKVKIL